jgi:hypothetical protein
MSGMQQGALGLPGPDAVPDADAAPSPPGGPHGPLPTGPDQLQARHAQTRAWFDTTGETVRRLGDLRGELDSLVAKGTAITPEHVIESAGRLVGRGADPRGLAGLLADMPEGAEPLLAWLRQHEAVLAQNEAQAQRAHEATRHALGVSALHQIIGHTIDPEGMSAGAPAPEGAPANG